MKFLVPILLLSLGIHLIGATDYLKDVKPLLASRCFDCHGALKQEAKLRVDTAQAMIDAEMIIPGKPDDSELIYRITSHEPEERMPPEHEGAMFIKDEVEVIRQWIAMGAHAPKDEKPEPDPKEHWAYQPIERPALPYSTENQNPVDAFINFKLQEMGLQPQPPADRKILLRRLYLDLIGLPPTLEQANTKMDYAEVVEELLASPHYGERWGRHWMDIWRYSDWYGLDGMLRHSQKHIWRWREWIIKSLNSDKGYDRMVSEMLAGDELDPSNEDSIAGTGFLARNYYVFNRNTWLDATIEHSAKAFLGITMNCAKCHDHKYDPISQVDYYNYRAFFEPHHIRLDAIPGVTNFDHDGLPRAYDRDLNATTSLFQRGDPALPDHKIKIQPLVPKMFRDFASKIQPVSLPSNSWAPGTRSSFQNDQIKLAEKEIASAGEELQKAKSVKQDQKAELKKDTLVNSQAETFSDGFETERPELWKIVGGGWRYQGGNLVQLEPVMSDQFVRSLKVHPRDFELTMSFRTTGGKKWKSVGVCFDIDEEGKNGHVVYASAVDGAQKVQVAHRANNRMVYPQQAQKRKEIQLDTNYVFKLQVRNNLLNLSLDNEHIISHQLPERYKEGRIELLAFDAVAEFNEISVNELSPNIKLIPPTSFSTDLAKINPTELPAAKLRAAQAKLSSIKARIAADRLLLQNPEVDSSNEVMAHSILSHKQYLVAQAEVELLTAKAGKKSAAEKKLADAQKDLEKPDGKHAPLRGSRMALVSNVDKEPEYSALYEKESSGRRLTLSRWITSPKNPLTARVAINHIWMRHFGTPLVKSSFDFGRRIPKPEHAQLLDWLASELMASNWSMKKIHRIILTSETWKRSASNLNADPATIKTDKNNRYYWRMNSRRMESQVVRDSLLHIGGELDLRMGGPSINPSPDSKRRALYFLHSRDQQSKFLATFDDAEILACYERTESIVPQQALALSNGKVPLQMSEKLGTMGPKENTPYIKELFEKILCRLPTDEELQECLLFLDKMPNRSRLAHALLSHNDFLTIR